VKARLFVLVLVAGAVLAASGLASPQGKWSAVTTGGEQSSISNIGVARTADGTLHVVWQRKAGGGYDLLQTAISGSGNVGGATPIVTGWNGIGDADLALGAGGERLTFFAGIRTTDTFEPLFGLNLATSTDRGSSWALAPASIFTKNYAYGRTPSVVVVNGVPIATWYYIGEPVVHVGLDPNTDVRQYAPPGLNENIAFDPSSGQVLIAWCNGLERDAGLGVWVQQVDPASGAGVGAPARMPGSFTSFEGQDQHLCPAAPRTALVARTGGGFFTASLTGYPAEDKLLVWRVGSAKPVAVAESKDGLSEEVALAADSSGRIWAGWSDSVGGTPYIYVRRSNRAATVWGAVVSVKAPANYIDFQNLDLSAQPDRLDVLARFGTTAPSTNLFHTQISPGLTLTAKGGNAASFRVTDAGDPVAGATVKIGGKTLKTNAKGVASIDLPAGSYKAAASKAGYASATASVKAT